ncbi:hypothetical protein BVRB_016320 [Beta vulgaris subsp. vulgaris]|uniref:Uncharacterized protein n=1 Tax=Beta vulgaris subsp. vulgaris TaxID=3555 RepID=A0A0J8DV25_BETVV|nr:hypothetical protein BVRB_016320 [Beta vulgaris subsp. vulgaris]
MLTIVHPASRGRCSAPSVGLLSPGTDESPVGVVTLPTRPSCRFGSRKGNPEREWNKAAAPSPGGRRRLGFPSRPVDRRPDAHRRDKTSAVAAAIWSRSTLAGFGRVATFRRRAVVRPGEPRLARSAVGVRCSGWTARRPLGADSSIVRRGARNSYLVDPASSHMLVSKIKPCMSKHRPLHGEAANGSLGHP